MTLEMTPKEDEKWTLVTKKRSKKQKSWDFYHLFWKAMPCVFDWIRENRIVQQNNIETKFKNLVSEIIKNDGFSFLNIREAQVLYKQLTTNHLNTNIYTNIYTNLWKADLGAESDRFLKKLKEYIYSQFKDEVNIKIQNVGGEVDRLKLCVMEKYLSKMLKFSPYITRLCDYSWRRHCREVNCDHMNFEGRKESCPFQITCEKDPWFLKLAETAQEEREYQRYKWDEDNDFDHYSD